MADLDLGGYKELYIKTAHEYVEAMLASFVLLSNDPENPGALETIYRSAHSLKSQSALMGYKNTASLNEFLEHTCRNIKDGNVDISEKMLTEIKTVIEKIEAAVTSIDELDKELSLQKPLAN